MIKCQNCGTENKDQWKFCLGCGSELPREAVAAAKRFTTPTPPAGIPVPAAPAAPAGFGAPPAAPAGFGPPPAAPAGFGAPPAAPAPLAFEAPLVAPPIGPPPEPVRPPPPPAARASAAAAAPRVSAAAPAPAGGTVCPSCGNVVPPDNKFCGRCGYRLEVEAAPAAAVAPVAPAAPIVRGRLVLLQPDGSEGASVPLGDGTTQVGRSTHPVLAGDLFLSPVHMSFGFRGGQLVVVDEGSANGLFYRLQPNVPVEIGPGDAVRFGQEYLMFNALADVIPDASGTVAMGADRTDVWGRLDQVLGPGIVGNSVACRGEKIVCGRERGHVLFPYDGYVSGAHLEVRRQGNQVYVTDLQSSNGTYLRIRGERTLAPNEILLVGQYLYRVDY